MGVAGGGPGGHIFVLAIFVPHLGFHRPRWGTKIGAPPPMPSPEGARAGPRLPSSSPVAARAGPQMSSPLLAALKGCPGHRRSGRLPEFLHLGKTEVVVFFGLECFRKNMSCHTVTREDIAIASSRTVRNFGIIYDHNLSFAAGYCGG